MTGNPDTHRQPSSSPTTHSTPPKDSHEEAHAALSSKETKIHQQSNILPAKAYAADIEDDPDVRSEVKSATADTESHTNSTCLCKIQDEADPSSSTRRVSNTSFPGAVVCPCSERYNGGSGGVGAGTGLNSMIFHHSVVNIHISGGRGGNGGAASFVGGDGGTGQAPTFSFRRWLLRFSPRGPPQARIVGIPLPS
ncbi:hypothetical protein MSAN_01176400 [Mycena sanguinolenta]|uniref:Uncharacterized protein n=1 Tax=Mycena sanguinolenta TaxID=230812 RepID=A0A8H6YKA0_9AGAR|nr:hypothetical protein MSAN_01176400 [Mycena sanguinolenta]